MSIFYSFVFNTLPYFTYVMLILGLTWRFYTWSRESGRLKEVIGKRLRYSTPLPQVIAKFVKEYLCQLKMWRNSKALWLFSWLLFHISLFIILIGHLRIIGLWNFEWLVVSGFAEKMLPTALGVVALVSLAVLVLRRINVEYLRVITGLRMYTFLVLLFIVIITGTVMRLLPHEEEQINIYIPLLPPLRLKPAPNIDVLAFHVLFVQLLIMYLPYSQLIHALLVLPMQIVRSTGLLPLPTLQLAMSDTCTRCGICISLCPTYAATLDIKLQPTTRMYGLRALKGSSKTPILNAKTVMHTIYRCNTCRACSESCPLGIDPESIIEVIKSLAVKKWGEH